VDQVTEEKDLGVIINNQMKFHQHTSIAASKAIRMIGVIRKTFTSMSIDTFLRLYTTLVHPHLEYGNVIWGPFYTLDQIKIENVQRMATRMVVSIKHLSYEQRLQRLGLPTLRYRRQRGDMICVYSLFNNIYDLDCFQFFTMAGSVSTRGHPFKPFKPQLLRDVRSHAFSQRVING